MDFSEEIAMQLEDFVAETLKQIVNGVEVARAHAKEHGAEVNPVDLGLRDKEKMALRNRRTGALIKEVEFDVAVTVTEGKKTKGGIGVFAAGIGVGAQGQSDAAKSSLSRIKFSVPLMLPTG